MTKAESAASRTQKTHFADDETLAHIAALELEAADLRSCIKDLRERMAKAEKNAEKRPDTVHEFLADENGVVDLLPSGDVVPPNLKLTFSGETGELIKAEVIE